MARLNFCKSCSVRPVKDVKKELEQWMVKRRRSQEHCSICNVKLTAPSRKSTRRSTPVQNNPSVLDETGPEIEVDVVDDEAPEGLKRHYYDPSMITRGLDQRVFEHVESANDFNKPFQCKICHASCAKIYNFLRHLHIKHKINYLETKPYSCEYCSEQFTCFTKLHSHFQVHAEAGTRFFKCTLCSAKLKNIYALRRHEKLIHIAKRNMPCSYCGKMFKDKEAVASHEVVHTNLRRFKCDKCPKKFRVASRLEQHRSIHLCLWPFTCAYCGHTFRSKNGRDIHERRHHTGVKGFQCRYCDFNSRSRKLLYLHLTNSHSEEGRKKNNTGWQNYLKAIGDQNATVTENPSVDQMDTDDTNTNKAIQDQADGIEETSTGSVSDLPPETVQAISNLLQQADVVSSEKAAHEVIYQCMDCGYKCADSATMREHVSTHWQDGKSQMNTDASADTGNSNETILYKCATCSYTAPNFKDLDTHARSNHMKKIQDNASGSTTTPDARTNVKIAAQPLESKEVSEDVTDGNGLCKCNQCSYTCSDITDLRLHKASHISVKASPHPVSLLQRVTGDINVTSTMGAADQAMISSTQKSSASILLQALAEVSKHSRNAAKSPPNNEQIKSPVTTEGASPSKSKSMPLSEEDSNLKSKIISSLQLTPKRADGLSTSNQSQVAQPQSVKQKKLQDSVGRGATDTATPQLSIVHKESSTRQVKQTSKKDGSSTRKIAHQSFTPISKSSYKQRLTTKTGKSKSQSAQSPLTQSKSQMLSDHLVALTDQSNSLTKEKESSRSGAHTDTTVKVHVKDTIVCQLYKQMPTKVSDSERGSGAYYIQHESNSIQREGVGSDFKRMTYM